MNDDNDLQIINPPNTLRSKVGTGGPGAVDLKTLERAEAVIAEMADDYLKWAEDDLVKLEEAFASLAAGSGDAKANIDRVYHICHDMKGQGGSFGYTLMTAIGTLLCRYLEKLEAAGPEDHEVVRLHLDAMKLVIAQRMTGDGGQAGDALLVGLQQVAEKCGKD